MKKIFILTGEPSGDKLASKVISKFKSTRSDIQYLSVGGEYLKGLGIKSLYDLKEITYLGFFTCPPEYPEIVSITPLTLSNDSSMHQKHPPAK